MIQEKEAGSRSKKEAGFHPPYGFVMKVPYTAKGVVE